MGQSAPQQAPTNPPPPAAQPENRPEVRMTQEQAKELFSSIDEIMQFASQDSGLPIRRTVKKELTSRDQVEKYVMERLADDPDQKRFERSELVLKKFGLIPQDFRLQDFMVKLLREQVAGFYDSKHKTVHMLDWISPESQKPVMAHELTHALQDQTVDLEAWTKHAREAVKKRMDPQNADAEIDEELAARDAVVEGQGMAVLLDYMLAPMHSSMVESPALVEGMQQNMSESKDSKLLNSAPVLMREALVFPYRDGMGFIFQVLKAGGKQKAFADVLASPPISTRQILTPEAYLSSEKLPDTTLPNLDHVLGKEYKRYDVGSMGQFDIQILLKQFATEKDAASMSPEWRGGIYYAGLKKAAKTEHPTTGDLALLYLSKWSSEKVASRFADYYRAAMKQQYPELHEQDGALQTAEGAIFFEQHGSALLIGESFSRPQFDAAAKAIFDTQADKTVTARGDLSMTWTAPVFALLRAIH